MPENSVDSETLSAALMAIAPQDLVEGGVENSFPDNFFSFLNGLKDIKEEDILTRSQKARQILMADALSLQQRKDWAKTQFKKAMRNFILEKQQLERFLDTVLTPSQKQMCKDQMDIITAAAVAQIRVARLYGYLEGEDETCRKFAPILQINANPNIRYQEFSPDNSHVQEMTIRRRSIAALPLINEAKRRTSVPVQSSGRPFQLSLLRNGLTSTPETPLQDPAINEDLTLAISSIRSQETVLEKISESAQESEAKEQCCPCAARRKSCMPNEAREAPQLPHSKFRFEPWLIALVCALVVILKLWMETEVVRREVPF